MRVWLHHMLVRQAEVPRLEDNTCGVHTKLQTCSCAAAQACTGCCSLLMCGCRCDVTCGCCTGGQHTAGWTAVSMCGMWCDGGDMLSRWIGPGRTATFLCFTLRLVHMTWRCQCGFAASSSDWWLVPVAQLCRKALLSSKAAVQHGRSVVCAPAAAPSTAPDVSALCGMHCGA
jgi:hypothetical protein